jgi:N-acyl-D-aspartate/D-glutamate deacylase
MHDIVIKSGKVIDGTGAAPFLADVAIDGGVIVEIGRVTAPGRRELSADGLLVTPGFIDVHTHYDGQATWDSQLDPSFSTGVTTAIMGNCGVGFAPVKAGQRERLIELMDGVEEIPGSALHEGLAWDWSSFPEYLNVLDQKPRSMDVGAYLPHGPLRLFVMGDKVGTNKCASGDELQTMIRLVDEAMTAGAFGLSSSRTPIHRTIGGDMTPDYNVDGRELTALAAQVAASKGIVQFSPNGAAGEGLDSLRREMDLYDEIVRSTGVTIHLLMMQADNYPTYWREQMDRVHAVNERKNSRAFAQVSCRSVGALLSFFGTHPFMDKPTFREIRRLPRDQWLGALSNPSVMARILAEPSPVGSFGEWASGYWHTCYDLGEDYDCEPDASRQVQRLASARGMETPQYAYEAMVKYSDHPRLHMAMVNYSQGNMDDVPNMLLDPAAVLSLSDAGAHVMSICDGSIYTFMLTHWGRDRKRGTLPLEKLVRKMTSDCANSMGITDRGAIRPGLRADINIIDFDNLSLGAPFIANDLPAGASRLLQKPTGYRPTIVKGEITRENDNPTGILPGRLLRHPAIPSSAGAATSPVWEASQ